MCFPVLTGCPGPLSPHCPCRRLGVLRPDRLCAASGSPPTCGCLGARTQGSMEPTGTTACPAGLALPPACSACGPRVRNPQPAPARLSPPPATPSLRPHARALRPGTALCSRVGIQAGEVDVRQSEPRGSKELSTCPEAPQRTTPLQHGDTEVQARRPTPLLPRQCRSQVCGVCGSWAVFCRMRGPRGHGAAGQGSQPLLQALVFATRPPSWSLWL